MKTNWKEKFGINAEINQNSNIGRGITKIFSKNKADSRKKEITGRKHLKSLTETTLKS